MHVLASELGFELQEWINPVADTTEGNHYFNYRFCQKDFEQKENLGK